MTDSELAIKQRLKINARAKAMRAVKLGLIDRPDYCSKCLREGKPQGHHPDYSKPLEVIWLCQRCHTNLHIELKTYWQSPEHYKKIVDASYKRWTAYRKKKAVIQQAGSTEK